MKTWKLGTGWGLVAVWIVLSAVVLLIQSWLFEANFMLSLAALPLLVLIGVGLLMVLLASGAWKAALAFMAVTVVIGVLPLNSLGHQAWTRISFAYHRTIYEQIVARAPLLAEQGTVDGVAYRKDGMRIVFPQAYGMPDGWSGVVHDPANTMPLNENNRLFAFGSNTQSCIRIERDWYRCWFD